MSELRTSIIIDLSGNLQHRARQMAGALTNLGRQGGAGMRMLDRGATVARRGLDALGNRYMAFLTGAAGVATVRAVGNLSERLTRLGIGAGRSADEMERIKKQVFDIANDPAIRLSPNNLLTALESIADRTGGLENVEANLRNIALAVQATGDGGGAIGEIVGQLLKMGVVDPRAMMQALDLVNEFGKQGGMSLGNFAKYGPRLLEMYSTLGRDGVPAVRELGAALKVIQDGVGGDPRRAAAAAEALLGTFADPDKMRQLERLSGLTVFDPDKMTQGERVLRPIGELMMDIVRASKGDEAKLSQVFDEQGVRAFRGLANELRRTGGMDTLPRFMQMLADGKGLTADSARAASEFNAALQSLYTAFEKFANQELAGPITSLAAALNSLEPGTVDRWLQVGKALGLTYGAYRLAGPVGAVSMGINELSLKPMGMDPVSTWRLAGQIPQDFKNLYDSIVRAVSPGSADGAGAAARREPAELRIFIEGAPHHLTKLKSGPDLEIDVDSGRTMMMP